MMIMPKMKVGGMKGKSELTIQPNYLSKEICDSLSEKNRKSQYLRQYHRKRKINDDMRPGWPEPRIMMLCREDASSPALSDVGPGYSYRDVSAEPHSRYTWSHCWCGRTMSVSTDISKLDNSYAPAPLDGKTSYRYDGVLCDPLKIQVGHP